MTKNENDGTEPRLSKEHTCHGNEHMPPGPCLACEEERVSDAWSQDWEPSGKCQYDKCDGAKFDWDSTDSRYGSWFCVKCGGMQLPPDAQPETPQQEIERVRESSGRTVGELRNQIDELKRDNLNLREQLDGLAGAPISGDVTSPLEAPVFYKLLEKWRHPCASLNRYDCADDLEVAIKVGSGNQPANAEHSDATRRSAAQEGSGEDAA